MSRSIIYNLLLRAPDPAQMIEAGFRSDERSFRIDLILRFTICSLPSIYYLSLFASFIALLRNEHELD